jgi:hypothetical protein
MIRPNRRWLGAFVLAVALFPGGAQAQAGQETSGRIGEFPAPALVLVIPGKTSDMETDSDRSPKRSSAEHGVAQDPAVTSEARDGSPNLLGLGVGDATQSSSQPPARVRLRPEVFVSIGRAQLHASESASPGWTNLGAGITLPLSRRVATQVEFNQMVGLSLETISGFRQVVDCRGTVCVSGPRVPYEAHQGTSSMRSASGNLVYYFSDKRLQPFVSGGVGVIWQRGVWYWSGDSLRPAQEQAFHKASLSIPLGAGIRISIPGRISVTPEVRYQSARFKLPHLPPGEGEWTYHRDVVRLSIAAGYQW